MIKPLSFKGSKEEIITELEERAVDRRLWGQDRKAEDCLIAAEEIRMGASEAEAVQTRYTVE